MDHQVVLLDGGEGTARTPVRPLSRVGRYMARQRPLPREPRATDITDVCLLLALAVVKV